VYFDVERTAQACCQEVQHATLSVEHIFLAALRQLLFEHHGGGVLHYSITSTPFFPRVSAGVILSQPRQEQRPPPSPSFQEIQGLLSSEQFRAFQGAQRAGRSHMFALAGPPPGWRPPTLEESPAYRELLLRQRAKAAQRGALVTTIYEVLADCLTYPQARVLLKDTDYPAETLLERIQPFLDPKVAAAELGPELRRWEMVHRRLNMLPEPRREEATRRFRLHDAVAQAHQMAQATLAFGHLLLTGTQQALRGGKGLGDPTPDPVLGPLTVALEQEITGGQPLPSYAVAIGPIGERVFYGEVPSGSIRVPPAVEEFLVRHRDRAAERGDAFTTYAEVLEDLLVHPEIQALLNRAGFTIEAVRAALKPYLEAG